MIPAFIDKSKIPHQSGVYIFKDKAGKVLYVGKAIDLYHRVASYFSDMQFNGVNLTHPRGGIRIHRSNTKVATLVGHIAEVETIVVESELEALILEANLIKKYLPPFNIKLTDDKDYLYIAILKGDFPKVITCRKKDLGRMQNYWGPFPSSRTVKNTLKSLRKVFPWCSNSLNSNLHSWSVNSNPLREWKARACFYYHLGLCPGACAGLISKKDYSKIISRFSKLMDGKKDELILQLSAEMRQQAREKRFEEAAKIKKIIDGITYLTQPNRLKLYLENPNFLEEEKKQTLKQLKKDLNLKKLPERIEGYDISNIQGKEATGSMVVLTNGEIDKSEYRRFKISPPAGPVGGAGGSGKANDVGMMREMLRRRFNHKEWPMPDLIIIDGGKGQVRGASSQLQTTHCQLPIFGLAKKQEWLYSPKGNIVKLPRRSLSLKLLQKIRDEAHRFAISYHRKLRNKTLGVASLLPRR